MDTERNQGGLPPQPDKPNPAEADKTNKRWAEWEIGSLLNQMLEGWKFESICISLRRSAAACKRMLARLLDGETPCPKQHKAVLEKVRGKFPPESKRHAHHQDRQRCREQIRQQYLTLAKDSETIRKVLAENCKFLTYRLAVDVMEGHVSFQEIVHLCPGTIINAVQTLLGEMREYRKRHPDLFSEPDDRNTGIPETEKNTETGNPAPGPTEAPA